MSHSVTLTSAEAYFALNTLRSAQINLNTVQQAIPAPQRAYFMLFNPQTAVALELVTNMLEAAIYGSDVLNLSSFSTALEEAAQTAIADFGKWEQDICDPDGGPDQERRAQFKNELSALLMLVRLATKNALPEVGKNAEAAPG